MPISASISPPRPSTEIPSSLSVAPSQSPLRLCRCPMLLAAVVCCLTPTASAVSQDHQDEQHASPFGIRIEPARTDALPSDNLLIAVRSLQDQPPAAADADDADEVLIFPAQPRGGRDTDPFTPVDGADVEAADVPDPDLPAVAQPPERSRYLEVYNAIPFSRAEYDANPGYRHEATMELLLGQIRPKTVYVTPPAPPAPAYQPLYVHPPAYYWPYHARRGFMGYGLGLYDTFAPYSIRW